MNNKAMNDNENIRRVVVTLTKFKRNNVIEVTVEKFYIDETKNTKEMVANILYKPIVAHFECQPQIPNSPIPYVEYTYARDILRHPLFGYKIKKLVKLTANKPDISGKLSFEYRNYDATIHGIQNILNDIEYTTYSKFNREEILEPITVDVIK